MLKTKPINGNVTLAMTQGNMPTFHSVINAVFEIRKTAKRHIEKFEDLERVLLKPPKVAFKNPKTLNDKLDRSKF